MEVILPNTWKPKAYSEVNNDDLSIVEFIISASDRIDISIFYRVTPNLIGLVILLIMAEYQKCKAWVRVSTDLACSSMDCREGIMLTQLFEQT